MNVINRLTAMSWLPVIGIGGSPWPFVRGHSAPYWVFGAAANTAVARESITKNNICTFSRRAGPSYDHPRVRSRPAAGRLENHVARPQVASAGHAGRRKGPSMATRFCR